MIFKTECPLLKCWSLAPAQRNSVFRIEPFSFVYESYTVGTLPSKRLYLQPLRKISIRFEFWHLDGAYSQI